MRRAGSLMITAVVAIKLGGCSTGYAEYPMSAPTIDRMTVAQLVGALRAGDIKAGDKLPVARLPKGWSGTSVRGDGDVVYGTWVARDANYVVLIYGHKENAMYGACSYSDDNHEAWYFCDMELMRKHIEASCRAGAGDGMRK